MAKKTKAVQRYSWFYRLQNVPLNVAFGLFFFAGAICLLTHEGLRAKQRVLGLQAQANAQQEITYAWEEILKERPDYRDGWLQLSALYLEQGDKLKAKEALLRAKLLDPNNDNILSLQKLLEN